MILTKSVTKEAALTWLESLGYVAKHGPVVASGEPAAELQDYRQLVLEDRLCDRSLPWLVSGELRAHMEEVA